MFAFVKREGIAGAFVPVALAVNGVKIESARVGGTAPVVTFTAGEALHGTALAATMRMAMPVPVPVESSTAEAAIGHALARRDETPIRAPRHFAKQAGAAAPQPHKTHRYRADRRVTTQVQDDAARAFHGAASRQILIWRLKLDGRSYLS